MGRSVPDPNRVAVYARVSTNDQEPDRQLDDLQDHVRERYGEQATIDEFVDIVSGVEEGEQYHELLDAIASGEYDTVVVHEISRLSRLGAGEIHEFIQHCLEHDTGVESLDVGLDIHVDDADLQQTVYTMIANIMGDLARIEREQTLRRIESGIRAAQSAGKWTGRPPRGFTVDDDGYLRVDTAEFLATREALAWVERGESKREVAETTGIPRSTVRRLYDERRDLYLAGEADDDRVDTALDGIGDLDDLTADEAGRLEGRIREIVRDELSQACE
jgi:DNA invertase Pin-like site-specific DNA recombinase